MWINSQAMRGRRYGSWYGRQSPVAAVDRRSFARTFPRTRLHAGHDQRRRQHHRHDDVTRCHDTSRDFRSAGWEDGPVHVITTELIRLASQNLRQRISCLFVTSTTSSRSSRNSSSLDNCQPVNEIRSNYFIAISLHSVHGIYSLQLRRVARFPCDGLRERYAAVFRMPQTARETRYSVQH